MRELRLENVCLPQGPRAVRGQEGLDPRPIGWKSKASPSSSHLAPWRLDAPGLPLRGVLAQETRSVSREAPCSSPSPALQAQLGCRCLGSTRNLGPSPSPSLRPSLLPTQQRRSKVRLHLLWSGSWEETAARSRPHLHILSQLYAQTHGTQPHASRSRM